MKYCNIKIECPVSTLDVADVRMMKECYDVDMIIYSNSSVYHPSYFSINFLNNISNKIVDKVVLDLFSGTGIVGLSLSKTNKLVDCADISQDAIDIINFNKGVNDCNNVRTIQSDVFMSINNKYDVIVGIPPMMSTQRYEETCNLEPRQAYDAGVDMLNYYKQVITKGKDYLLPNGKIYLPVASIEHKQQILDLITDWKHQYVNCENLVPSFQFPCEYLELSL